jgi:hypothetical protein
MKPAIGTCEHKHVRQGTVGLVAYARVRVLFNLKISEGSSQTREAKSRATSKAAIAR